MTDSILVLNPGSSSLKAAVYEPSLSISVDRLGTSQGALTVIEAGRRQERAFNGRLGDAVDAIAAELAQRRVMPAAVGHRVVHGGPDHYRPTVIDQRLLDDLRAVIPLAPLHLPGDLESIEHARRNWPDIAQVACFDTEFHHDLPESSRRLPVPAELLDLGVRRYGFHGLSMQSVLHAHPDLGHAVIAHLGSGCSVTAVADGHSRHTTMSLTPTGGTISATRTGDLDPEIALYLIQQHGYSVDEVRSLFDHGSGLAGIADGRHDVRDLLDANDPAADLALDVFATDIASAIAGCATHLDQWDSLVFTGGIGENSPEMRERICRRLLAVRSNASDADLGATGLRILVVPADEEGVIERAVRRLM